ncbi:sigma-70 family RNA polymerase sigma factor [Lysinibacillus sp. NPDC092081]|uniref:sigma-70 family RNA polymerase sigma factor n=1 Tax=Lysinibacillus sp. NPDC092081 TaxID=3364131 RepID=UPI0037F34F60
MLKEQKGAHLTRAMTKYGDYLLRVCYTYVQDWTVAEDLVQDTFVKYYEKMEQFREESSVKTYLYRITINNCHSYLSSWRYKKLQVIDYWSKLKSLSNNPEKEVLMGETDALLVASIEKLPTKYKDVLLLFHFAEFSLKDVAALLKLPENTVKTRLRRARQMVGITLLEEGFEYGSDS